MIESYGVGAGAIVVLLVAWVAVQHAWARAFPDEMADLAADAGHYTPRTLTEDLKRLHHEPEIWLTGMKPGEEDRIFEQVVDAAPDKDIRMLSAGTVLNL